MQYEKTITTAIIIIVIHGNNKDDDDDGGVMIVIINNFFPVLVCNCRKQESIIFQRNFSCFSEELLLQDY